MSQLVGGNQLAIYERGRGVKFKTTTYLECMRVDEYILHIFSL